MQFDWDSSNENHIARHKVTRIETEQALCDPFGQVVDSYVEGDEMRYRYVGATTKGRLLVIGFTMRAEAVRPITAFDADSHTAGQFRQGAK
jgi:uncharacterized DUF497 family protein